MLYEYSGFLSTVLDSPDPDIRDGLASVSFGPEELAQWRFRDLSSDPEWQHVPSTFKRTEKGVRLEGRFKDIRQIDNLAQDDPSFWVPLSSLGWRDNRFPIDVLRYPVIEVTYRCVSPNAHPALVWTYPGGSSFDWLAPTQEWRTVARLAQFEGLPSHVDAVALRLYSISRTTESIEIESVRFREMSTAESDACRKHQRAVEVLTPPKRYPILDEFMPFGCYMDAGSSKRLAAMLGISLSEYWALVLEDIARHYHNSVAIEGVDRFTSEEWRDLLVLAEQYGVKFYAIYSLPFGTPQAYRQEFVQTRVKPYADSPSILAWSQHDEPPEKAFQELIESRALFEEADPNHPTVVALRQPTALGMFARFFPVIAVTHYGSHVPWQMAESLQTMLPACKGQHLWAVAPGFIYATDTPEWHTCPEMRLMMNLALANGARGWYTFSYHNDPIWIRGSCQRSLTGPFLTFSDLWSELSLRTEFYSAVAPLLLESRPDKHPDPWFSVNSVAHANSQLPSGIPATSTYHLRGEDYDLYCVVSNDIREMTTAHVSIAPHGVDGMAVHDLSDFVTSRTWAPMGDRRHYEMFPGQQHIILVTKPDVAARWREVIARRLVENDRRRIKFDLALAQMYGLDTRAIEALNRSVTDPSDPVALVNIRRASDLLLDLLYECPAISEARSKLIEISAALCACDGSLCRLLGWGKVDQARQLGFRVIPIARELSHLRLELRQGKGAAILEQCYLLSRRALETLSEIRSVS